MVNAISFPVCIIMLLIHHLFCFILFNCSGFGESRGSRGKVYLFFFFSSKCIIWSVPSGAPIHSSQRVLNPLNQGQPFPGEGQSSGKGKANANSTNEAVWSRAGFDLHPWRTEGVTQVFSHLSGEGWKPGWGSSGAWGRHLLPPLSPQPSQHPACNVKCTNGSAATKPLFGWRCPATWLRLLPSSEIIILAFKRGNQSTWGAPKG